MNFEIRTINEIGEETIERISFIEKQCFSEDDAFPADELAEIIANSPIRLGAYVDGVLVGYSLERYGFGMGYLYSNAVLPEFRNMKIGSTMTVQRMTELHALGCRTIQAHTRLDNEASAYLLRTYGFSEKSYVTDFYGDNNDAILWSTR